jgi:hypothetical protein
MQKRDLVGAGSACLGSGASGTIRVNRMSCYRMNRSLSSRSSNSWTQGHSDYSTLPKGLTLSCAYLGSRNGRQVPGVTMNRRSWIRIRIQYPNPKRHTFSKKLDLGGSGRLCTMSEA